jgi:hypothetical protein
MMQKYGPIVITSLMISVVWGYYADLSKGQVGAFIGRILFVTAATVGCAMLFERKNK